MPKVSILCMTYNHGSFIRQALESFVIQKTDFDFEILIHDDASADNTVEIIKEFEEKYPGKIKTIFQTENQYSKGVRGFVMKYLIPQAVGEYLAVCDGDDFFTDENKLQLQVDFLDNNLKYSLCFHPTRVFFENKEGDESVYPNISDPEKFTTEALLRENFIPSSSVMYRRQKYDDFPTGNMMPNDWYLHLYHAKFGKIGFIDRAMSAYRRHSGGVWWASYNNASILFRKHGASLLNMYLEVLKLYGDIPGYKEIITDHIRALLNQANEEIDRMQTSIFWKLRGNYMALKRLIFRV